MRIIKSTSVNKNGEAWRDETCKKKKIAGFDIMSY